MAIETLQAADQRVLERQARQSRLDRRRYLLGQLPAYAILSIYSLSVIFALSWAVIMSLRTAQELFTLGGWALPRVWAWQNYVDAWRQMRVGQYFYNTLLYSGVGTAGAVFLSACLAYVIARVKFRGRTVVYYLLLISLMIPGFLSMVPRYFLMKSLGLVDTQFAIFLLYWTGGLSFNTFLLVNFFETLPIELEEAAFIDGASAWQIFWRVMLPLARPGLAAVAIFTFLGQWNDFMTALIYLRNNESYPLALGLQFLAQGASLASSHTKLFAGMVIFMVPILTFYLVLKDYITEGLTFGAVKG